MVDESYKDTIVYAGEVKEEQPQQAQPQEKTEEKKRRTSDWILVVVAAVGLILTVYYIGFGHLTAPITLWPNATNQTQPQQNESGGSIWPPTTPGQTVNYGPISSITYSGEYLTLNSREDANLSFEVVCSFNATCRGLYISVYDGTNEVGEFQNSSTWTGSINVTVPFVVPRRDNAAVALSVFADSVNLSNTKYGANAEAEAIVYINVLAAMQKVIYGKEFYLDVGETANLTDLNVTLKLESLQNGEAKITVKKLDGTSFSSTLDEVNKPNATFFDFLTIQLIEAGDSYAKLVAWPNGVLEFIGLQYPSSESITAAEQFSVSLKCSGTCAATYVGIHILYETNLSRIGFFNETKAWSGLEIVNITTTIPEQFFNRTCEVKILADTRNSRNAYFWDLWHPAEKEMSKNFFVSG